MQRISQRLRSTSTLRNPSPSPCSSSQRRSKSQINGRVSVEPQKTQASTELRKISFPKSLATGDDRSPLFTRGRRQRPTKSLSSGRGLHTTVHDVLDPLPLTEQNAHVTQKDIRTRLRKWSEEQAKLAATSGTAASVPEALPLPNSVLPIEKDPDAEESDFMGLREKSSVEGDVETEYADNVLLLEPGDVFQMSLQGAILKFAVFLGMKQIKAMGLRPVLLLEDGRWVICPAKFPNTVIIPSFATADEVELLYSRIVSHTKLLQAEEEGVGENFTIFGELALSLTEDITRRLRTLYEEISSFQREHRAELDRIYDTFALEDKFNAIKFKTLVSTLFKTQFDLVSMGGRYTIFAALRRKEGLHTITRSHSGNLTVYFTPKQLYKRTVDVTLWARQYQDCAAQAATGKDVSALLRENPLNSFINKARKIILKSRKVRSPTTIGSLGPCSSNQIRQDGAIITRETGESLSMADLSIIDFMWNACLRKPHAYNDTTASSIAAMILRAIGAYPKMQLGESIARLFFREIGLMAPWSEVLDEDLRIPAPGRRGSQFEQTLIRRADKWCDELGFTADPTKIPLHDTMADLRKDWGDTAVYCIDSPSTNVLDDGISIEDSLDIPGATWVHVHIAHPTAFISPSSLLSRRAEALTSSIYTLAKVYPMFPEDFVHSLSLKRDSPVMTISSLILKDGQVKDVKVTVGTIRNVIRLDPSGVQEVLRIKRPEEAILQVGPSQPLLRSWDLEQFADVSLHENFIQRLNTVLKARTNMRREEVPDFPKWRVSYGSSREQVSWIEKYDGTRHSRSYHYLGDPTIKVTAARSSGLLRWHEAVDAQTTLTAWCMILAGESVGRWLKERQIPAVYSGTALATEEHDIRKLNNMPEDQMMYFIPRGRDAPGPISHVLLGVSQYVKMTSPLRRYYDNVAQWQIDAFLRVEANGQSVPAQGPAQLLPFSTNKIIKIIQATGETAKRLEELKIRSTRHWSMQALFRAFHFNEAPLPAVWDAQILRLTVPSWRMANAMEGLELASIMADLMPFRHRTLFIKSEEGWEANVRRFQYLPVKIEYVDTTRQEVYVKAVGPASDEPTQKEPILCIKPENESQP